MTRLLDRLRKAEGPSRELDWAIAEYLGEIPEHSIREIGFDYDWYRHPGEFTLWKATDSEGRSGTSWAPLPRTSSLDAAVTLVPEGMGWIIGGGSEQGTAGINGGCVEMAATPALALVIAAIQSRTGG